MGNIKIIEEYDPTAKFENLYYHIKRPTSLYGVVTVANYLTTSLSKDYDDMLYFKIPDENKEYIVRNDSFNFEMFQENTDIFLIYKGILQCSGQITYNTKLVMYINIVTRKIWFRPESEFMDSRFVKVEKG